MYGVVGLSLRALLIVLYDRLGSELASVSEDLGYVYARLRAEFRFLAQLAPSEAARLPTPDQVTQWLTDHDIGRLEQDFMAAGQGVTRTLGDAALVLILSVYWTADHLRFERFVLSLIPADRRAVTRRLWRRIEDRLGYYLRGELVQSALAGALLAPAFILLGLQWPVTWALAVSLAWLVPFVGVLLVIVPMAIVVYVQSGLVTVGLAMLAVLAVFLVLQVGLSRALYRRDRGTNVLTIMAALIMADSFGLVGLVLAPPVAEAIYVLLTELATPAASRVDAAEVSLDLATLEARLAEVQALVPSGGGAGDRRLASLAERLQNLLGEARAIAG